MYDHLFSSEYFSDMPTALRARGSCSALSRLALTGYVMLSFGKVSAVLLSDSALYSDRFIMFWSICCLYAWLTFPIDWGKAIVEVGDAFYLFIFYSPITACILYKM